MAEPEDPTQPDPDPEAPSVPLVGPTLGAMLGLLIFSFLPEGTSLVAGSLLVLVVVALSTYVSIEVARRRHR